LKTDFLIAHTACLVRSFKHWTGKDLLPGLFNPAALAKHLFKAPLIVVSHGTEADPIFNYGNQAALNLWEMTWEEFIRTPSRLTAEAPDREERARLLEIVMRQGFINDYSGARISKNGKRFKISNAIIWNLISENGTPNGQAAMFSTWKFL
jgi:hypothetical protein